MDEMREIKFRAWDEKKTIMHKNFQFIRSGVDGNDWIIFDSDTEKQKWDGNFNPYFAQQFKIMQYTGLKDKNGVDVFEGDILEDYDNQYIGVVSFEKGAFIVTWEGECCNAFEWSGEAVVGNIYEHPHLSEHL